MFTKKDFHDYFSQVLALEEETRDFQISVLQKLNNPAIKNAMRPILGDERQHVELAKKMLQIVDADNN